MPLKFNGVDKFAQNLSRAGRDVRKRSESALYLEAQIEMTEAKRRTPVWNPERKVPRGVVPGALRASGKVHPPEWSGDRLTVTLSFGTDYAIYVHEDLDAFHAIGQAKFLESTLKESAPHIASRVAKRMKF